MRGLKEEQTSIVWIIHQIHENGDGKAFSLDVASNNTIFDEADHFVESVMSGENSSNPGNIGAKNTAVLETLKIVQRRRQDNRNPTEGIKS